MKKGLVSLVVPMYNTGAYLSDFIKSVQSQSYRDWELLLVDDGSSDDSCEIARAFASADGRIRLLYPKGQKGACARRNQGYDESEGEFVCFFDSDDLLPQDTLAIRVGEMKKNPDCDFIVTPAISFDSRPFDLQRLALGLPLFKDDLRMFLCRFRLPFGVWTNIYRRSFLQKSGLRWDEGLGSMQDSDFNIRALAGGAKYGYASDDTPGYYWRTGGNTKSITKTISSAHGMGSQFYFYSLLVDRFYTTPYEKAVKRFGQTLMRRAALLQVCDIPGFMKSIPGQRRFACLEKIYHIGIFRKVYPLINLLFFPLSVGKEYAFLMSNRRVCKKYIIKSEAARNKNRGPL